MLSGHFFETQKAAFRRARCRQCPVLSGHILVPPFFYEIVKTVEKRQLFWFFAFLQKRSKLSKIRDHFFESMLILPCRLKKCAFREGLERVKLRKYRWRAPCIKKSHCGLWRGLPIKVLRDRSEPRSRQPPLVEQKRISY